MVKNLLSRKVVARASSNLSCKTIKTGEFYKLSPALRAPSLGFERGFLECKDKVATLGVFE
jgi:hypothetical protein